MENRRTAERYPLEWSMLTRYQEQMELEEKSGNTIQKYIRDVTCFFTYLGDCCMVSKKEAIDYKQWLIDHYAVRSANSMLAALNHFFRSFGMEECCVKTFKIQRDTFSDKRSELTLKEYRRLVMVAAGENDTRLCYLLQTLCATGIRVGELPYITVQAAQQGTVTAHNKGKSRVILLPRELCRMLLCYAEGQDIREGAIFVTRTGQVLNRSNIWSAMKALCVKAQVDPRKVYPHNLRHLFARTFYAKEKDITHLADVLGHRSVNTTWGYVMSDGEEHRRQIDQLNLCVREVWGEK